MEHAAAPINSVYGDSTLHCFCFGPHEEDNVLVAACPPLSDGALVRVQSACYTGEIFRSSDCDCHEQLDRSMRLIHTNGGLFVYMLCDGRGAGLITKLRGLALGELEGLDTFDAYRALGVDPDPRTYERVCAVLASFGISHLQLLTNNPRKIAALEAGGITVRRVPLIVAPTPRSASYLKAKHDRFGHLLDELDSA